ncbi:MAG TPA: SPOR domain-containing protein, partial [Sphingomonadaceae bacterium]
VVAPQPAAERTASAAGPWKVQLGVFSVPGNAERLWAQVQNLAEVSGKNRLLVPAGKLTKLLAGGYASEGDASAACQRLKQAGHDCVVTR